MVEEAVQMVAAAVDKKRSHQTSMIVADERCLHQTSMIVVVEERCSHQTSMIVVAVVHLHGV